MNLNASAFVPYLVAINLTRRCNLSCPHCYLDAHQREAPGEGELTREELAPLFQDLGRRAPGTIVVLSGGEPLLHPGIEALVAAGVRAKLRMVLGTNGTALGAERIRRFKNLGLSGVGVSLDSVRAERHDAFRGLRGSFEKTTRAIRMCRANGLHVQLHFTVTRENRNELAQAAALGRELGARIINFFFLVCLGRGKSMLDLSPERYEEALRKIARLQREATGLLVQTRCAPHFKRILYEHNPDSPYTRASGYDGGGCLAATHYCRISPLGEVTPCPYLEHSAGNIREQSFWTIWDHARLFRTMRQSGLEGRCGNCEFTRLCGGCRARAWMQSGRLTAEDPNCAYLPRGGPPVVPSPVETAPTQAEWTPEARECLNRIPLFLRGKIKKSLEALAVREGRPITADWMRRRRKEREKALGFRFDE